ncbi:MAG: cytochrome c oxidase subunit 3 [Planctomycetota bacterium]
MLKRSLNLVPARQELYRAKLVFYLFLASLGMFFIGSLITYLIVRRLAFEPHPDAIPGTPMADGPSSYVPLEIPLSFWISTALLLLISFFLQKAVWAVQRQKLSRFQTWLNWSMFGSVMFFAIQAFGMYDLFAQHFSADDGSMKVYGMSFTMAFIHALHVFGGMVFLGYIIVQARRNKYDHERHWAVDHCASYWHFLDVVWACMLITFVVAQ